MRVDALAMLLSMANAAAGARVLVLDGTGGLVTAAVVERLGGLGEVCVVSEDRQQQVDVVRTFNFGEQHLSTLFGCTFQDLSAAFSGAPPPEQPARGGGAAQQAGQDHPMGVDDAEAGRPAEGGGAPGEAGPLGAGGEAGEGGKPAGAGAGKGGRRAGGGQGGAADGIKCSSGRVQRAFPERLASWAATGGFSSLVVAAPTYDTRSCLRLLLPFLSGGAPFVAFHNALQPLAETLADLRDQRIAAAMDVHEPWMRDYQVLPSRTHPKMQMSATGGYLLCGHKLVAEGAEARKQEAGAPAAAAQTREGACRGGAAACTA